MSEYIAECPAEALEAKAKALWDRMETCRENYCKWECAFYDALEELEEVESAIKALKQKP
jgi:hypothetical protein